jgi:hypothetical protein
MPFDCVSNDNNETSGNRCSMDAVMEYGEEVAR